jgi:hypothetical protein
MIIATYRNDALFDYELIANRIIIHPHYNEALFPKDELIDSLRDDVLSFFIHDYDAKFAAYQNDEFKMNITDAMIDELIFEWEHETKND